MSDPLVTYGTTIWAVRKFLFNFWEAMRNQQDDQEFRQFASVLLPEIQADDLVLRRIAERLRLVRVPSSSLGNGFLRKPHV